MLRARLLAIFFTLGLIVTGCGGNTFSPAAIRQPTFTPTPLSTALPTVPTQVPLGAEGRAFHLALAASNADGSALAKYLSDQTGAVYQVDVLPTVADVLRQLCGGKAALAWLDGPSLLSAQGQGCGDPILKAERGSDNATGIRADLIVRIGAIAGSKDPTITAISGFKGRDFCRLNSQDLASWILPALAMRAAALNPAQDLRGIKEFPDTQSLVQAVAGGLCAGAGIPSGTLSTFSSKLAAGQTLTVLQTTAEMPFGGLVAASTISRQASADAAAVLIKNPDTLGTLVNADAFAKVGTNDYSDFQKLAQAAALNFKTLGQ